MTASSFTDREEFAREKQNIVPGDWIRFRRGGEESAEYNAAVIAEVMYVVIPSQTLAADTASITYITEYGEVKPGRILEIRKKTKDNRILSLK
jgi:hypothetical protein